jgi:AraC-like DNA-binding protein/quercetin dioxygenase-like cupin family protein
MSRTGQGHGWRLAATDLGTVASTWQLPDGTSFPQHRHGVHQLSFAGTSAIALGVADRTWVLPRGRGLWVPAGVSHSVEPIGAAEMITLWFEPERCPVPWDRPTVVDADELLLALVDRLLDESLTTAERTRSERVLFDVLQPVPVDRLDLALPSDDRARRVAEAVLLDPGDARTLSAWGRAVGASERTLMRAFRAETGIGFQEWRTRARMAAALRLLLTDTPVSAIAPAVGYTTTSAFSAAFRRTMGAPPSAFRAAA